MTWERVEKKTWGRSRKSGRRCSQGSHGENYIREKETAKGACVLLGQAWWSMKIILLAHWRLGHGSFNEIGGKDQIGSYISMP